MAILVSGDEDVLRQGKTIGCFSSNSKKEYFIQYTEPRPQYLQTDPTRACSFVSMIITCNVVSSPNEFYIFDAEEKSGSMVNLDFEYPVQEKLGVVSCMSSVYFGEQWQLYSMSIEYHRQLGIGRQVYYLMSSLQGVYELFREYNSEDIIDLRFWTVPDVPEIESLKHIWNRDQIGTINDCFTRYREAADFIIIHDPDELLWMRDRDNFHETLANFFTPDTVSLSVRNFNAEIISKKNVKEFDLKQSMDSISFVKKEHPLKSIYQPKFVETAWVHWPLIHDTKFQRTWIDKNEMKFIHLRNWSFSNEYNFVSLFQILLKFAVHIF